MLEVVPAQQRLSRGAKVLLQFLKTFSKATTAAMIIDTSLISGTCEVKHTGGKRSTGI